MLPGHVPMLSAVKAGTVRYRKGQDRGVLAVGPGFAEVSGQNKVVALVQRALPQSEAVGGSSRKLLADANEKLKGEKRMARRKLIATLRSRSLKRSAK